jgi:hypothetical protein
MFIIFNDVQYLLWYIIFHIKLYGILKKKEVISFKFLLSAFFTNKTMLVRTFSC